MSYVSTDIKKIIAEIIENKKEKGGVKNIYFVGCGGSLGALYPAKTFMEREAQVLRSAWINSNEFVHSTPKDFGENSIICLACHKGNTPETIQAAKLGKEKGAAVIILTWLEESEIIEFGDYIIRYTFDASLDHLAGDIDYAGEKTQCALLVAVELLAQTEGYENYEKFYEGLGMISNIIKNADLGRLSENKVTGLKQVTSGQIAGGFAGKTTFAYLANINLDSELVKGLVTVVNQILKALWLDELQKGQVIKIDLGIIEIDALYDGKLVSLNLLGLDIKVGLAEDKSLATIYIGDSKIEINCSESGTIDEESLKNEINISLIKANRTKIDKCTVTGIADGYDVYGGGAGNNANGTGQYGIAGGFVGWNNEGLLENNNMFFADVIRGAKDLTGPFTGKSSLNSNWEFNDVKGIEGNENYYRIYRNGDTAYEKLFGKSGKELQHNYETSDAWKNVYTIRHMTKDKVVKFTDLKDAMMSGSAGQIPVNVYQEDGAMAVLMNNTASSPTEPGGNEEAPDVQDPCKDLIELRLKKVWKRDEEKDRPNEVIFNITRSYEKDGKPVVDTNFNKEVILTKKDAQTSDIWEKVLTGAEYTAYHVGTDGKKYYYTYHVSEMKVDGYTTEITYKGDRQYSITVTNTKNWFDSLLPETGGMGKALLYALGVLLLCLVTATEYRKRKSTRSQSSYK